MIQANEKLMVGNYVTYHSEGDGDMFCQLDATDIYNIATERMGNNEAHSPIPISSDILEYFGFHRLNNAWVLEGHEKQSPVKFSFSIWHPIGCDFYKYNSAEYDVEITSLHQLQNLYYALTHSELKPINVK